MCTRDKIKKIEIELKKVSTYDWHNKKQTNDLDKKTNFIYNVFSYEKLILKLKSLYLSENEKDYAITRWFNYISAMSTERFFSLNDCVNANHNKFDKLIDFSINGITFDHKGTVFPKAYRETLDYAINNKIDLIKWFYTNQSSQGRQHYSNRLFIVFHSSYRPHWKMKAELLMIKENVDNYLANFDIDNLSVLNFEDKLVYSDIIFVTE
ncbi:MAG: hypothetical protein JXM74_05000 [Fusobacteriaceae bacterium]|nr:hypothetical protein [Fusobacteriaceae bacterium]